MTNRERSKKFKVKHERLKATKKAAAAAAAAVTASNVSSLLKSNRFSVLSDREKVETSANLKLFTVLISNWS